MTDPILKIGNYGTHILHNPAGNKRRIAMRVTEYCFYQPGDLSIIDMARNGRSECYNESAYRIKKRYPNARLMPFLTACRIIDAAAEQKLCTDPIETTAEEFYRALEILPPRHWRGGEQAEYFCLGEMLSGDIGELYFRVGDKYFSCTNRIGRLAFFAGLLAVDHS